MITNIFLRKFSYDVSSFYKNKLNLLNIATCDRQTEILIFRLRSEDIYQIKVTYLKDDFYYEKIRMKERYY